jgi:hypothetical protein
MFDRCSLKRFLPSSLLVFIRVHSWLDCLKRERALIGANQCNVVHRRAVALAQRKRESAAVSGLFGALRVARSMESVDFVLSLYIGRTNLV